MKLIIDIDDELIETAKFAVQNDMGSDYVKSIANGTPLDNLRAELHATAELHDDGDYYLRDEWIDEYFDEYKANEVDDVLDKIRAEISEYKDDKIIHAERNEMIDIVLGIIDHYKKRGE